VEQEPAERTELAYRVATRTDIGLRRERNEDYMGVDTTAHGLVMVVCDGMGGHRGGERASRIAVEAFLRGVKEVQGSLREVLASAVEHSNRVVCGEAREAPELWGMGTTLVAALVRGAEAAVVNVGDSRAYRFRRGDLTRITIDHSHVGELVARGELTEEEAQRHPQRNLITRALGVEPVREDLFDVALSPGDRLLLSTDGLHGVVPDDTIAAILGRTPTPERACDALIEEALARGGGDNITVAVVEIGDDGGEQGPATAPITLPPTDGRGTIPPRLLYPLLGLLLLVSVWAVRYFIAGGGGATDRVDSVAVGVPALVDSIAFDSTAPQPTPGDLVADSGVVDSLSEPRVRPGVDSLNGRRAARRKLPPSVRRNQ